MKATKELKVDRVVFTAAPTDVVDEGLIGFVRFRLNEALKVTGVAVRKTLAGRPRLSFPCKRDRNGLQHYIIRPVDDATRRTIEDQVFRALGLSG